MSSFLGKKISLISKAQIRYEGVLYTIDQSAFTVALSKVRSFGTEDRPAERHIAARDEVYEYIIFRGADISDLHVCQDSAQADDSAIVTLMSPNVTNSSSPPAPSQIHAGNTDVNTSDSMSHKHEPLSPITQPPINISKRFMNLSKGNNRNDENNPGNNQDYFNQPKKSEMSYGNKYDSEDLEEIAAHDYRQFKNREQSNKSDFNYDHTPNDENRQYSGYRRPASRRGFRNYENNARGYMSTAARGRQAFMNNKDVLPTDSIKDDFDFESSNALIAEELANMQIGHTDNSGSGNNRGGCRDDFDEEDEDVGDEGEKVFYDKSKSFFDNISSEVSDRTGNNMGDRRRRNNVETFGSSEYGRGGNRGYRGSRWNGSRGAFRGNYVGSSAGFIRRGGNSRRGDGRIDRGQFNQRRPFTVNGGISGFGEDN